MLECSTEIAARQNTIEAGNDELSISTGCGFADSQAESARNFEVRRLGGKDLGIYLLVVTDHLDEDMLGRVVVGNKGIECQSARNRDPLSACKRDPSVGCRPEAMREAPA